MKDFFAIAIATSLAVLAALPVLPRTTRAALAASADDTKTEPAHTSAITKLPLPEGAVRVKNASIPPTFRKKLASLVAKMGPRYYQGKVEVVVWTGSKFKPSQISAIKAEMTATMSGDGWSYGDFAPDGGTDKLTRITGLKRTGEGLLGFFAATDDALVMAWTEVLPIEMKPAQKPDSDTDTSGADESAAPAFQEPSAF